MRGTAVVVVVAGGGETSPAVLQAAANISAPSAVLRNFRGILHEGYDRDQANNSLYRGRGLALYLGETFSDSSGDPSVRRENKVGRLSEKT